MVDLAALPGAQLVEAGLADLQSGRADTVSALLVAIAAPRLRRQGLAVPDLQDAEIRLYRALCEDDPRGAYARYNALLRRLTSFARALEREEGAAIRKSRGG